MNMGARHTGIRILSGADDNRLAKLVAHGAESESTIWGAFRKKFNREKLARMPLDRAYRGLKTLLIRLDAISAANACPTDTGRLKLKCCVSSFAFFLFVEIVKKFDIKLG